jgi:nitrogen fixation protein FixH
MTGKDGNGLEGLDLAVSLSRPVGDDIAITASLDHRGGGVYRASVTLPHAGRWRAEIIARDIDNAPYHMVYEIMVAP